MLDINLIINHSSDIKNKLLSRGYELSLNKLEDLYFRRKDIIKKKEDLAANKNQISDQFKTCKDESEREKLRTSSENLENEIQLNKDQLLEIIQKIGENIKISYFEKISSDGAFIYSYLHTDKKLAALVKLDKDQPELGRDIAMQVSANSPLAISAEDIDQDILDKEKEIAIATLEGENKPDDIKEKIVIGKLNKFKQENSLVEQPFIKDPDQKIKDILNGAIILAFARKKVGQ